MRAKFIIVFLIYSSLLYSQSRNENMEKELEKIYKNSDFPGFAVGIIKNDSIIFSKAYGFANVKKKELFTENTIIPIASVSKTLIAFSLAKAMELGYFDEETPINDILPFQIINPHQANDIIKVKHLFTHTSTIIDNEITFLNAYQLSKKPSVSLGAFLQSCLDANGDLYSLNNYDTSKVGSTYIYSNIASALAAYLIEVKSKMTFDEFTQKYIFNPLNLETMHWFYDDNKSKDYAGLYEINVPDLPFYKDIINKDKSVKTYSSIIYPDGSLKTSLKDLTVYIKEIIQGYNGDSDLLTEKYYDSIFKKRFTSENTPINIGKKINNQAMFWVYNNKGRITHTGSDPGVFAVVSIDLKKNIGRVLLINANIDTEENQPLIKSLQEISDALEKID